MKKGIIVASFGTTYHHTRQRTIGTIEEIVKREFPQYPVERAFTSSVVINKLRKEDIDIMDINGAMEKLADSGVTDIYIQPLHIIPGIEYEKVLRAARDFMKSGRNTLVRVGTPLLWSEVDYMRTIDALALDSGTTTVFMGHGSRHSADEAYERLEACFRKKGYENVHIGSLEGKRPLDEVLKVLKGRDERKVTLKPFMLVAGDHVENDMISKENDSWKSMLSAEGFDVDVDLVPLGEVLGIQEMFISKLREVVTS